VASRKARGVVEERRERWYLRIRLEEVDAATGELKRREQRIPLGDTTQIRSEAAARREADAWLARRHPEKVSTGEQIMAGEYFERFLRLHVATLRRGTRKHHRKLIRNHLSPHFGSLPLARIGAAEIQGLIAHLVGKRLQRSTIKGIRAQVLQILTHARLNGFDAQQIDTKLVRVPMQDVAEREKRSIAPEELDRILAASDMPWRALWAILGYLGLRVSEALALTWKHLDIDSTEPLASIRQSTSHGEIFPLKTKTSRADLPLPAELATRTGTPRRAEDVRQRQLLPLLTRQGIPHAGFHAYRHGLPRQLFAAGCSASVVQQLMRHSSLRMTEIYTHTKASDLRAAQIAASEKRKTLQTASQCVPSDAETLENKG
jgi:integrase